LPPTSSLSKRGRGADCSGLSLFFIELRTRKVEITGIGPIANGLWMEQIGRNLTDPIDGILKGKRYLIHDRDPLFTGEFLKVLGEAGVASVSEDVLDVMRPVMATASVASSPIGA